MKIAVAIFISRLILGVQSKMSPVENPTYQVRVQKGISGDREHTVTHVASGVLISREWVLTAGSVFPNRRMGEDDVVYQVESGTTEIRDGQSGIGDRYERRTVVDYHKIREVALLLLHHPLYKVRVYAIRSAVEHIENKTVTLYGWLPKISMGATKIRRLVQTVVKYRELVKEPLFRFFALLCAPFPNELSYFMGSGVFYDGRLYGIVTSKKRGLHSVRDLPEASMEDIRIKMQTEVYRCEQPVYGNPTNQAYLLDTTNNNKKLLMATIIAPTWVITEAQALVDTDTNITEYVAGAGVKLVDRTTDSHVPCKDRRIPSDFQKHRENSDPRYRYFNFALVQLERTFDESVRYVIKNIYWEKKSFPRGKLARCYSWIKSRPPNAEELVLTRSDIYQSDDLIYDNYEKLQYLRTAWLSDPSDLAYSASSIMVDELLYGLVGWNTAKNHCLGIIILADHRQYIEQEIPELKQQDPANTS